MRIAEACRVNFKLGSIQLAAEYGSAFWVLKFAFGSLDRVTAIPDGKVKATIGTDDQAVHVVATKRDAHTIAIREDDSLVRDEITIGILQSPKFGNVRVVDHVVANEDSRAGSFFDAIESRGKDRSFVRFTIVVGIFEYTNNIIELFVLFDFFAEQLPMVFDSIGNRHSS